MTHCVRLRAARVSISTYTEHQYKSREHPFIHIITAITHIYTKIWHIYTKIVISYAKVWNLGGFLQEM